MTPSQLNQTTDKESNDPVQIPKITPISSAKSPDELARGLHGKYIDEFGNILGWDGTVMGRVEGDLPSMVGQQVCSDGQIRDTSGDVAGYVSENLVQPTSSRNMRVGSDGIIYDQNYDELGKMKHNEASKDDGAPNGVEDCKSCRARQSGEKVEMKNGIPQSGPAAPSPSEIYLDVKSTQDGIQLIIKIPTIFNGKEHKISVTSD